jgi:uncharacterized protein YbjT (DUF2867 family)
MIVIIGATSSIGKATFPLLRAAGHSLRLTSRQPEKLSTYAGSGVEIMPVDLLDEDSMRRACAGAETVFASIASLMGRGKYASRHVDYEGQCRLIDIARESGVKHFVYMSTLEATLDNPVAFFRYKAMTEAYLKESGLSYTILRASAFFEPHATLIGGNVLKGGKAMIMGKGENPRNFVSNADVAQFAYIALTDPKARNQVIDIGGPENLTNRQIAALYAKVAGVELKQSTMPRLMVRVMGAVMRPFHPGLSDIMGAVLDADTRPKTFDMRPTLQQYPVKLTRLEDWVRAQAQTT